MAHGPDDQPWPPRLHERNLFRRQGRYWTIVYRNDAVILRDMKGLAYLSALLEHPGEGIPAMELARRASPSPLPASGAVAKAIRRAVESIRRSCPPLAEHLEVSIRTGAACVYRPDSSTKARWRF